MKNEELKVIFTEEEIAKRVKALGKDITADYEDRYFKRFFYVFLGLVKRDKIAIGN